MAVNLESRIDGNLSSGYYFKIRLSPGTHTLTATVTDSDRATASTSVKIVVYPYYFYDRKDAVYSPHGSVLYGETACYDNYCIKEIEPWDHSLIGVFDRDTDQLLYTIDENHGSLNNIKGLAILNKYLAIIFHGGYNNGIWVREITTGELVAHIEINRL